MQYECAAYIIDSWMDTVANGRTNVAPTKIPWDLIRTLIVETYGGKVDHEGDFKQLAELVGSCITPQAFEIDYELVRGTHSRMGDLAEESGSLIVPEGNEMKDFTEWVNQLPDREPPTYLGLPVNAERLLLMGHGRNTITNLAKIAEVLDETEQLLADDEDHKG